MMYYTNALLSRCKEYRFREDAHLVVGEYMILNENEMLLVDADLKAAAVKLGGTLMSDTQMQGWIRDNKLKQ